MKFLSAKLNSSLFSAQVSRCSVGNAKVSRTGIMAQLVLLNSQPSNYIHISGGGVTVMTIRVIYRFLLIAYSSFFPRICSCLLSHICSCLHSRRSFQSVEVTSPFFSVEVIPSILIWIFWFCFSRTAISASMPQGSK